MDFVSATEQFAALLNPIATFVAILTAIYGINAWRREHMGKRRIELAEDALAAFYEASDAVSAIRHPMSFSSETDALERHHSESEELFEARKRASVAFVRYNERSELFGRLHAMRYRFMAQIGKSEAEPFLEIRQVVNEVMVSARLLSRLWAREHFRTVEQQTAHFAMVEKHEAVIWAGLAEDDQIERRVNDIVERFEVICRRTIEGTAARRPLIFRAFRLFRRTTTVLAR